MAQVTMKSFFSVGSEQMCFSSPYCYSTEYTINYILISYESSFYLQRGIAAGVPRSQLLNEKPSGLAALKYMYKQITIWYGLSEVEDRNYTYTQKLILHPKNSYP